MATTPEIKLAPAAQRDVEELKKKIGEFRSGQIPEDKFKHFRLTRGVYGQRQAGVHMFRLKIPYGKITPEQLRVVARISRKYTNGNLHLTTRQNIQLHHVKLDDSPAIWEELEACGLTAREACGNTVRNITASANAGIDPEEPFDVTPYVQAVFEFFLRNPICQDMGRKIKMAFSSSEKDSAFTFIHDFGFIPIIRTEVKGFKIVVGGGLGAQSILAQTFYEFLPADQIIDFLQAALRVFDRFGEREKRMKARLKFLIKNIGLDGFRKLVEKELQVIDNYPLILEESFFIPKNPIKLVEFIDVTGDTEYTKWYTSNVFEQKQKGFFAVQLKVPLGNIDDQTAISLADLVEDYLGSEFRITVNQGLLINYVKPEALPFLHKELKKLGLGADGFDTLTDVTSCPGTDTCNLAVTNSTALSVRLEEMIARDFSSLAHSRQIQIKISGCMNSCGQHMIAGIGFHGSSIKNGDKVIPAMQVVLGGGVDDKGQGWIAEKVVKIPSKRIPDAVALLLRDYEANANGQFYAFYFQEKGKMYFYNLLKPLADIPSLQEPDYMDWGAAQHFIPEIGVGECAGVAFDLVSSILKEAEEKLEEGHRHVKDAEWSHAAYQAYNVFITSAKALLLSEDISCNTQSGIVEDFDQHFVAQGKFDWDESFAASVYALSEEKPTEDFTHAYLDKAASFLTQAKGYRASDKEVISNFYKA